jgi:hypothetical protein
MSETETPSAQIVAAAVRQTTVKDSLGRTLTVKRMSVSERMKFLKAVPPAVQQNSLWITNAMIIASVKEIDGLPTPPLLNETAIERAGDALGDEGLEAAGEALAGLLPKTANAQEALTAAGE